jgi:uncharacterized RDD family membrane protein YckC
MHDGGPPAAPADAGRGRADDAEICLFWASAPGEGTVLSSARFRDGKLAHIERPARVSGPIRFDATLFRGRLVVVYGCLPERVSAGNWLQFRTRGPGGWLPSRPVRHLANVLFEEGTGLTAAGLGDTLHVVVPTRLNVLGVRADLRMQRARLDGETWAEPAAILTDGGLQRLAEHGNWVAVALAVLAAGFVASAVIAHKRPRRASIAGCQYVLAPWWRRGSAYALDVLFVYAIVALIESLASRSLGRSLDPTVVMMATFCVDLFYVSSDESTHGRTLGKRLLRLFIVSRNGGYPSWSESALRNIPRALADALWVLPLIWLLGDGLLLRPLLAALVVGPVNGMISGLLILNTRGSQQIGDFAAGTYVVEERPGR